MKSCLIVNVFFYYKGMRSQKEHILVQHLKNFTFWSSSQNPGNDRLCKVNFEIMPATTDDFRAQYLDHTIISRCQV
jgi:hypothetical protein